MTPERRHFPVKVRRGEALVVVGTDNKQMRMVLGETRTFHSAEQVGEFAACCVQAQWFSWRSWSWRMGMVRVKKIYEIHSEKAP